MNPIARYTFCSFIFALAVISVLLAAWPLPALMMSEENSRLYFDWIFGNGGSQDPSRFAALPFVWIFLTLPGAAAVLVACLIMYAAYRYLDNHLEKKKLLSPTEAIIAVNEESAEERQ